MKMGTKRCNTNIGCLYKTRYAGIWNRTGELYARRDAQLYGAKLQTLAQRPVTDQQGAGVAERRLLQCLQQLVEPMPFFK